MKHTNEIYDNLRQLCAAHQCDTPLQYVVEAYKRTSCGVWTAFLMEDGRVIASSQCDSPFDRQKEGRVIGIRHGTIVEGSDAEFTADDLLFPFSDKQLADAWQYLEDQVSEAWPLANG